MTLAVRFIRHGESVANAGGVTAEPSGIPLTELGREQALAIARGLSNPPDLIITSPYTRARDSAAPTAARFPDVPLEVWPVQEFASLAFARRADRQCGRLHRALGRRELADRLAYARAFFAGSRASARHVCSLAGGRLPRTPCWLI